MDPERLKQLAAMTAAMPQDATAWTNQTETHPFKEALAHFMGKHFGTKVKGPAKVLPRLGNALMPGEPWKREQALFSPLINTVRADPRNEEVLAHEAGHAIDYALHPRSFLESLKTAWGYFRENDAPVPDRFGNVMYETPRTRLLRAEAQERLRRRNAGEPWLGVPLDSATTMENYESGPVSSQALANQWGAYLTDAEVSRRAWDNLEEFRPSADSVFAERGIPMEDLAWLRDVYWRRNLDRLGLWDN